MLRQTHGGCLPTQARREWRRSWRRAHSSAREPRVSEPLLMASRKHLGELEYLENPPPPLCGVGPADTGGQAGLELEAGGPHYSNERLDGRGLPARLIGSQSRMGRFG